MTLYFRRSAIIGGEHGELQGRRIVYDTANKKTILLSSQLVHFIEAGLERGQPQTDTAFENDLLKEFTTETREKRDVKKIEQYKRIKRIAQVGGAFVGSYVVRFFLSRGVIKQGKPARQITVFAAPLAGVESLIAHEVGHALAYWLETGVWGSLRIDKKGPRIEVPSEFLLRNSAARLFFYESGPALQAIFYLWATRDLQKMNFIQLITNQIMLSTILGSFLPTLDRSDGAKSYQVMCETSPGKAVKRRARYAVSAISTLRLLKDVKKFAEY